MFKKIISILFSFILFSSCYGLDLTHSETVVLESFLKTLIENSEGGYVLYNKKPVCINGFQVIDTFYEENQAHKDSVCLREGSHVWEKIPCTIKNDHLIIHISHTPDCLAHNYFHVLFINKDLFLKTVQSNLSLFQYVLGPAVTPENLLNKLLDPNVCFHSVLKEDKVLIGILLGFGTQNSIYGSRMENIQEALLSPEQPPYANSFLKNENYLNFFKNVLLFSNPLSSSLKSVDQPSFSYHSLSNEIKSLEKQMEVSSPKLSNQRPFLIFGKLKEDPETHSLIQELESVQDKIIKLLDSRTFLEDVLKILLPQEKITLNSLKNAPLHFSESEKKKLSLLISASIWENIQNENEHFIQGFISGMQDAHNNIPYDYSQDNQYEKLKILTNIAQNIARSDEYFAELDQKKDLVCISPGKLYYHIIQPGNGSTVANQTHLTLHYTIKNPDNIILADTWASGRPMKLDLQKAISGFAWGMKGMKIGEIREIFIHPSVGYGIYTHIDKGIYLIARTQLIDIQKNDEVKEPFPSLSIFDFTEDLSLLKNTNFLEASREEGYRQGYSIWKHYKIAPELTLQQVLQDLSSLRKNEKDIHLESQDDQNLINRLHWNIYNVHLKT